MADQREVEAIIGNANFSDVFSGLNREEKKAKLAAVRQRGITNDRLSLRLPHGLHGEWVADDPVEIDNMRAKGYELYNGDGAPYAKQDGGRVKVADVVLMVCSKETYEILEELRQEEFIAAHGNPNKTVRTGEKGVNAAEVPEDIQGFKRIDESTEATIGTQELVSAVKSTVAERESKEI